VGVRYYLRSLESGNPGRPKSGAFLELQIEAKELVHITMRDWIDGTY
jgi:hypothetical protein